MDGALKGAGCVASGGHLRRKFSGGGMSCSESSQTETDPLPPYRFRSGSGLGRFSVEPQAGHLVTFLVTFDRFTGRIRGLYSVDVSQGNRTSRGIHPAPASGGQAWGRRGAGRGGEHEPGGGLLGVAVERTPLDAFPHKPCEKHATISQAPSVPFPPNT